MNTSGTSLRNRVIGLCILINMLDGFDIMAMAYTAPALGKAWRIAPENLGLLFSAGLAGMMLGSMVIGLIADRAGRRPMILLCLAFSTLGMIGSWQAGGVVELGVARFVTGLAIGGMLPCINSMVAEFADPRSRTMAISLMQAGFTVGASAGGFLSILLLDQWGWSGVFLFGAVLTAALLPFVWWGLPESLAYLASRPNRKTEYERLCNQLGIAASQDHPAQSAKYESIGGLRSHWAPLLLIFQVWFLCIMSYYFLNSWVPKILADGGLTQGQAVAAGAMLTAGGIISAIFLGLLSLRSSIVPIISIATFGSAAMTALFGSVPEHAFTLLASAFVLGVLINFTQIGLYAILPGLFPSAVRAGATGLAIGVGRFGAVIGPWLAGLLLAANWTVPALFLAMALPYAIAGLLILNLAKWQRY